MPEIKLGYGQGFVSVSVDDNNLLGILNQNKVEYLLTGEEEVRRSLEYPTGTKRLGQLAFGKTNVVIITSDITRPCPSYKILPSVLDELCSAGIETECITIVFATGNHRKQTCEEMKALVGNAVFSRIRCIDADSSQCVRMGTTSRGTPVDIFREVASADLRICIGNIEYHYFAGYSGGYKAIMPGVSTSEAIAANHRLMTDPRAAAGIIHKNPVREDIEEAGLYCPVDFIVNVVLDDNKEIIFSCAGDPIAAHRAGCEFLDKLYSVAIQKKADIVITSAGGFPKDQNMYQAQKALDNAKNAVRDGGIIIWVAECTEGLGEQVFSDWMTGHDKSSDMISHIENEFILGAHKAAAIAMVLEKAKIFLVSSLEPDFAEKIFLSPYSSVKIAYDKAKSIIGDNASVIVIPNGGSVLPVLTNTKPPVI